MDPRKERTEAIFGVAIELATPEQRSVYLASACTDDPPLRHEVEQLISAYEQAGGFLTSQPGEHEPGSRADGPRPGWPLPVSEKPGEHIGRYKLLERIGEGGCGIVYVAEQEEPVRRRVALKVIKLGMDTRSVIARFEAERQALAMMDHPNIAKVLDAGATATGRPFFVMELVRGLRITDYCDQNSLSTGDRLDLFIQVCHAIQHAHHKGIIHRDIKPSNILVTLHDGVPVPKVIDFGIAKATTHQRLTDKTVYTAFEQFIGTPAYMSPEQAELSGLDLDTRSDIYALGVLLYELLTGKTPFDPQALLAAGVDEMRRIIREQEPLRPSTRLSSMRQLELTTTASHRRAEPPKLIHSLRGDLDWIVMKCLEKDRTRRYETANGLAQDIGRHLNQEPVAARPPSLAYRAHKFVRRNQIVVGAAAAVFAVLLLGIALSTWQAVRAMRAEREQTRLRQAADQARALEASLRLEAEAARRTAEQQQYSATIGEAQALIDQGQYGRAKQVLARPALAPWRGWEWGWLERTCNLDLMTFSNNGQWMTGVAFSPDGRWLAAGSFDCIVHLWDLTTGSERRLSGHGSTVVLLGFSPDSRRLASASFDKTARVWDVASGQELFTLTNHGDLVYCATFSPDGRTIATASADKTVRFWKGADGAPLGIAGEYGDRVMCVAFSPDGRQLAYAGGSGNPAVRSMDTTVRILDLDTGKSRSLAGHSHAVPAVAFTPDGSRIITASWDLTARVADAHVGTNLTTFFEGRGFGGFLSIAPSPDGRVCALGGGVMGFEKAEAGVHVIELATGRELHKFEGHSRPIRGVAFSPDGTRIASSSFDGTVKIWPSAPLPEFLSLEGHDQAVWKVAVSPNGRYVATGSLDQTAKIWELQSGRPVLSLPVQFPVVSLAFTPDSQRLITVGSEATARVWVLGLEESGLTTAPRRPDPALTLRGHDRTVTCVACSPRGRYFATGSKDQTARIWDSKSGRLLRTLRGHGDWVLSVAFSPDETRVATASADHTAGVWDVGTGRLVFTLQGHAGRVLDVAWSLDGKFIATGGQDAKARLWDATTGLALLPPLGGHRDGVSSVVFSPDGRRLATAAGGMGIYKTVQLDNSVFLWNVATRQTVLRLRPHLNVVRTVTFSPDGTQLITGSVDNTARVRSAFAWRSPNHAGAGTHGPAAEELEHFKTEYWSQFLAAGTNRSAVSQGDLYSTDRRLESRMTGEFNVPAHPHIKTKLLHPIPMRNPAAAPSQIDLSALYNCALNENWLPTTGLENLDQNLASFPAGLRTLGGVRFDARGVIQLGWSAPGQSQFPTQVRIPIGHPFHRLHVLHAVARSGENGALIGRYRLHYADGQELDLDIRYNRDLSDWWDDGSQGCYSQFSEVAWRGPRSGTAPASESVRLFRTTCANPRPEAMVAHIDYISSLTQSAPFLLAVTVD